MDAFRPALLAQSQVMADELAAAAQAKSNAEGDRTSIQPSCRRIAAARKDN
jgi:hypothetical protein